MATVKWASATNGDWASGLNWLGGLAPTLLDAVVIDAAGTYQTTLSGSASALSLTLASAGATFVDNGALTLGGPLTLSSGLFQLGASGGLSFGTNPGVINVGAGATFQALGTQTLDHVQINMGAPGATFAMFSADDVILGAATNVAFVGSTDPNLPSFSEMTGASLTNNGTIAASQNGASALIYFTTLTNSGTLTNTSASGYTVEANDFVNTGVITAGTPGGIGISAFNSFVNSGVINDTGGVAIASPGFVNNGQINLAGAGAYLALDAPMGGPGWTITGTGAINVSGLDDNLMFVETQTFGSGTVNLTGSGELLSIVSSATNAPTGSVQATLTIGAGATINQSAGTATIAESTPIAAANGLDNEGTINASAKGGSLTITAPVFINNGVVAVSNGDQLTIDSALSGTGQITIASGATAEFSGADAASVGVSFLDGAADVLKIDPSALFLSGINGFAVGDAIDLAGVVATGASWSGNVLSVKESNGSTLNLALNGAYAGASFKTASDGAGGTNITLGAVAAPPFHWAKAVSGDWATGSNWTGGVSPGGANDATIDLAGTYAVSVSSYQTANSLTLNAAGASLNDLSTLSVGALNVNAGTINLGGPAGTTLSASTLNNAGTILANVALGPALPGGAVGQTNLYFVDVAGAFTNTGALNSTNAGGVLAELMVTAGSFTNSGTVASQGFVELNSNAGAVTNNGTMTSQGGFGIGVSAPSFVNNGQINIATGNDDLEITSAYPGGAFATPTTISGTGAINVSGVGSRVRFIGTQTFASGTINLTGAGATLTDASVGVLPLPTSVLTFGAQSTINVGAAGADLTSWYNTANQVINNGAINVTTAGASLTIDPSQFANNGTIAVAQGDALALKAATTGTGTISLASGASAEIFANIAAGQTVSFLDGAADLLKLDAATGFASAVAGFAQGDTIDLAGVLATGATWANNVLTVAESNGSALALSLLGNYAGLSFATASDGAGGTDITVGPKVVPPGVLSGALTLTSVAEAKAVMGSVATFVDTNVSETASLFSAVITWGDGSTSAGVVTGGAGAFSVAPAAGHAYADEGAYAASVTITRTSDGASLALGGTVTATEADALSVASAANLKATTAQALSNVDVATFSDSNLAATAADFSATIAWGDGVTTSGTVSAANGAITVIGSHTYAAAGNDTVVVTLKDVDGSATATASGAATVSAPSSGSTYTLTTKTDTVSGTSGDDTIIAATNTLTKGDLIDGGAGTDTLSLSGGGVFNLSLPATLTNVEVLQAYEGAGANLQTITLRAGLNLTVNVASSSVAGAGVTIVGAADSSVIHLGAGADTVTLGAATETALGGGGADVFNVTGKTIGGTIDGGAGPSKLVVSGGGAATMGANITRIHTVNLASAGSAYNFTANAISGLIVNDLSVGNNDAIHAGAAGQVLMGGSGDQTFYGFGSGVTDYADTAKAFNGSNIRNFGSTDLLDVTDLAFGAATKVAFSASGSGAGDLNIKQNGALASQVHIFGLFNASSFAAMSDGHGGMLIYDTAKAPTLAPSFI